MHFKGLGVGSRDSFLLMTDTPRDRWTTIASISLSGESLRFLVRRANEVFQKRLADLNFSADSSFPAAALNPYAAFTLAQLLEDMSVVFDNRTEEVLARMQLDKLELKAEGLSRRIRSRIPEISSAKLVENPPSDGD